MDKLNEIGFHIVSPNDYARYIGAPEYHPLVSVFHYDELGKLSHCRMLGDPYGFFIMKNFPAPLSYGTGEYALHDQAMFAFRTGQTVGVYDSTAKYEFHGWGLLFDPVFMHGTTFEKKLSRYHFFFYNTNESLPLDSDEYDIVSRIMEQIRKELKEAQPYYESIVQNYIIQIADLCQRYYERQFQEISENKNDLLARFQDVLNKYYEQKQQLKEGIPTVKFCAEALCMSPSYFGDLVNKALGQGPLKYIRWFVIDHAKSLLASGMPISDVSHELGFDYPQHFSRVFKQETGMTATQYLKSLKQV